MPRRKRLILPGLPHHITARGNYRQQVFFTDADFQLYLDLLADRFHRRQIDLHGYCLMPNHVHLIASPHHPSQLERAMQQIQSAYSRWQHLQARRTGHLWQGRFDSVPLDQAHFSHALAYVEHNPVRARLVTHAAAWKWSSARAHLDGTPSSMLTFAAWSQAWTPAQWHDVLDLGVSDARLLARIREATTQGLPLGDNPFLDRIERDFKICARPRSQGRPRKPAVAQAAQSSLFTAAG